MAINVSNNKPVTLSPIYTSKITGPFEPNEFIKETVVKPLYTPFSGNGTASIDNDGNPLTEEDIVDIILSTCGDSVNVASEDALKELYHQTLIYYDKAPQMGVDDLFAVQAGASQQLPMPTPTTVYTPNSDVIPSAREFLGGQCDAEKFFASLAFFARPDMLGFYFANERSFDAFKTWFNGQCQTLQTAGLTTANTNQILADFQNVTLNSLTEAFTLRDNDGDNNEDYSFARLFISMLMLYSTQVSTAEFGCLPFSLKELYCPKNVVLVNVEKHSRASGKAVREEWEMLNKAITQKLNLVSTNKLNKLAATQRTLKKIASGAAAYQAASKGAQRAQRYKFSKSSPKTVDLARIIKKIMDKMAYVARSENIYRSTKTSYQKPNRRDPDDYNKPGKIQKIQYKPDIHLYIDTSGSVSERNYQDAVKACIQMAKKLNVNLYFNSFSHCLSTCTKLNCKDRSLTDIYAEFQKVPKVTGGTNYEQIWHYINESKKRKKEISVIMTDFEWSAPNHYVKHPKNLYYIPLSHMDWDSMIRCAEYFCKSMVHIDPDCRRHLLF